MSAESTIGWLKLFFQVFTMGFIFLIIAYYTLDILILLILAIIGGVLAILSLIVAVIISKRENIKIKKAKINWDDVKIYTRKSRRH